LLRANFSLFRKIREKLQKASLLLKEENKSLLFSYRDKPETKKIYWKQLDLLFIIKKYDI